MDELELISAARNGDRSAYGELYRQYAPLIHGVLLARVDPAIVGDLLQDVFLKAMLELDTLRDEKHFGAWLCAIARNRANDHYRQHRDMDDLEEVADSVATPERVTTSLAARRVLADIQSLPDAYRETLTLRLVEGLTGPEIAQRTGLSRGSVRVNLHRGLQLLREQLRPASPAADDRAPSTEGGRTHE